MDTFFFFLDKQLLDSIQIVNQIQLYQIWLDSRMKILC